MLGVFGYNMFDPTTRVRYLTLDIVIFKPKKKKLVQ